MPKIRFNRLWFAPSLNGLSQRFREGWSGVVDQRIASAAIQDGAAEEIKEPLPAVASEPE